MPALKEFYADIPDSEFDFELGRVNIRLVLGGTLCIHRRRGEKT